MPKRIQLRRTKGWRKPPGTIVVARPSKWGNPFRVGGIADRVALTTPRGVTTVHEIRVETPAQAVEFYRRWLNRTPLLVGDWPWPPPTIAQIRAELAWRNLACWCALVDEHGQRVPCHADVLLELANG